MSVITTATLPAGKYYIGDLCYVLPDAIYHGIYGNLYGYKNGHYRIQGPDGVKYSFVVAGTYAGDGLYRGGEREYEVDAGIIGMVDVRLCNPEVVDDPAFHIQEFDNKVNFRCNDGIFKITCDSFTLIINTRE